MFNRDIVKHFTSEDCCLRHNFNFSGQKEYIKFKPEIFIVYEGELHQITQIYEDNVKFKKIFGYYEYNYRYTNISNLKDMEIIINTEVSKPKIRLILEKEYIKIRKKYMDLQEEKNIDEQKIRSYRESCLYNIKKIKEECNNKCSEEKKQQVLREVLEKVYANLEIERFYTLISQYGLKTDCTHEYDIEENEEELEYIDSLVENRIAFKELYESQYKYEKAHKILYGYLDSFCNVFDDDELISL